MSPFVANPAVSWQAMRLCPNFARASLNLHYAGDPLRLPRRFHNALRRTKLTSSACGTSPQEPAALLGSGTGSPRFPN